ncbi:5-formyltetrahydrofolate cyclo-ligase [Pseudooceanicola sp.]|uniref:5-formyltetrahydrofolate cyclo-ligase n=1 Tax=Pseudooceanicola sp. TaxID=1914328 RepID=UPI00405A2B61
MTDHDGFAFRGGFSSPPCMAGDIAPNYFDPLAVDPQQARDVARWRQAERVRLRAVRSGLTEDERRDISAALLEGVRAILGRLAVTASQTIAVYWPIRGEPDLRPLMARLHDQGQRIALPSAETLAAPLVFREWTPDVTMERGQWTIPAPTRSSPEVRPDVIIAPLLGWDAEGFRLGQGGGDLDRTLAALTPRPISIGVGVASARLSTIFPQPHDIPLDVILTERGIAYEKASGNGPG